MTFRSITPPALLLAVLSLIACTRAAAQYRPGPDSQQQPGVPRGEVLHFTFENSKLFPGTFRDYWVYVPAQYNADERACLYVNQDGVQWNAPTVFDNLIAKKEMPVTIGVFVMHGRVRAQKQDTALDRFNRSYEYDGLGPNYADFLVNELLPDVETRKTSDGRPIRFSHDPKDRAIGGSSSGAVCAFTAAWERPDQFSRVFSAIGTYVGLRGADRYPTLIRKYEPKRLRIFLQDGSKDQNIYAGDWWMENQMMERALTFAGYEVDHAWGTGGHSGEQGTAIFPDVMRWLWKGWPNPVGVGTSRNAFLTEMLVDGEGWRAVGDAYKNAGGLAAHAGGEVAFTTGEGSYRVSGDGSVSSGGRPLRTSEAVGPDGRTYALTLDGKIVAWNAGGKPVTVARGLGASDFALASNGLIYAVEPGKPGKADGKVWLIHANGKKTAVDTGLSQPRGLTLAPDQALLYVSEGGSHWVYSYQVQRDGTLHARQQYDWLHVPDTSDVSDAAGMCVDRDGRLYVATNMGIQVCDQAGRVNCILPLPSGRVTGVAFGGPNGDTLYAATGDHVYRRRLKVRGTHPWEAPNKPTPPRL